MTQKPSKEEAIGKALAALVNLFIISPLLFMWLYNMILVPKFSLPRFSYLESMGLIFIFRTILK